MGWTRSLPDVSFFGERLSIVTILVGCYRRGYDRGIEPGGPQDTSTGSPCQSLTRARHCKLQTIVDDQYAGKSGPCAGCGVVVVIPLVSHDRIASKSDHPFWKWLRIICLMLGILAMVGVGVSIVTVIALPTYTAARNSSRREICSDNLERIAAAMDGYRQEHGHFPPAFSVDENGQPLHSWRVFDFALLGAC